MSDDENGVMVITDHKRWLWIEQADPQILVSLELIQKGDPEKIVIDGSKITFKARNGWVTYFVVAYSVIDHALVCRRITAWPLTEEDCCAGCFDGCVHDFDKRWQLRS